MAGGGDPRRPVREASEQRFRRTEDPPRAAERETAGPAAVDAIAQTDAYRRLVALRRRFTLVAGGVFGLIFGAFVALAAWAHDWMGTRITSGLTVGYLLALVVIVAVWLVVFAYSRVSTRVLDPLAERAQEEALG